MSDSRDKKFVVGRRVRIRGEKESALIQALYLGIDGGVRLDRPLCGFVSWNIKDLVLATGPKRTQAKRTSS